jgi:hypothetical protein
MVIVTGGGCTARSSTSPAVAHHRPPRSAPATSVPVTGTSLAPSAAPTTAPVPIQPVPGWTAALTSLPPGGGFSSLSCISDTFCVAVGGGTDDDSAASTTGAGVTVSWDGAAWSEPSVYFPVPPGGTVIAPVLPAISCTAGPSCTIVDGSGHVSTGDGTNWSAPTPLVAAPVPAANPADPGPGHAGSRTSSIACPTPAFCTVADNTGHTFTARNGTWVAPQAFGNSPTVSLYQAGRIGVTCLGSSFCTAVVGASVLDWDGTTWSQEPTPWTTTPVAGPTAVACPSTRLCAIVAGPSLWIRNGPAGWSPAGTIDPGGVLDAIACPTASFCLAADTAGKVLTWNGSSWSAPRQVIPTAVQYTGPGTSVSCPTARFCMVLNGDGDYATYSGPTPASG